MSSLLKSDPCGSSDAKDWKPGIHFITFDQFATFNVCVTAKKDEPERSNRELRKYLKLALCPDGDDKKLIDKVMVYKTPLDPSGQYTPLDYHGFILLKIGNLFATLDKHTDGLTVQSSEERDDVLAKLRGAPRYGVPEPVVEDQGTITVGELIDFIMTNDFIYQIYNIWRGNHCKRFAKDIFDKVADISEYEWEQGELSLKLGMILGVAVVAASVLAK